jgi:hypothetical protein
MITFGEVPPQPNPAAPLTVSKTATSSAAWSITKSASPTLVEQIGGTATFDYTVVVTSSDWQVTGTITVSNPNAASVSGVNVADSINDANAICVVTDGLDATIPASSSSDFPYACTYSAAPASSSETNTVTVTWPEQTLSNGQPLDEGSATGTKTFDFSSVDVTDSLKGSLGSCSVLAPCTFTYPNTVSVPQWNCQFITNTATIVETGQTASATVEVCGPAKTGALTMGFWHNKNGQAIIKGAGSVDNVCKLTPWLRQYAPFNDLPASASCNTVATYDLNVFNAANAAGASMNKMLKAQMLATALDVYFSDPALGGNKIGAPGPIGDVTIDLTKICKMSDQSGGVGKCTNAFQDVSSAFGGATSMTVSEMLAYAASQANGAPYGWTMWYGNVKAKQGLAKDAFDAINNQCAFAPWE